VGFYLRIWCLAEVQLDSMIKNDLSEIISLEGTWNFSLGNDSPWVQIEIPSCWEAAGYSKFIDGPAYYKRSITIPESWSGQSIQAEFEAVSYASDILVNGVKVAEHRGMWTPFNVDISSEIRPGEQNTLELVVFKPGERYPMRSTLAGFLPDVATTFGGIWQPARIRALQIGLKDFNIEANIDSNHLNINCMPVSFTNQISPERWEIIVLQEKELVTQHSVSYKDGEKLDISLEIPEPRLWSLNQPSLYNVLVSLVADGIPIAQVSKRVGFRNLISVGDQLILNGQPIQIRGVLSWGWEPNLIAPAYSADSARQEMIRAREMGFNLIKLCLFVPNQTYYEIADEEGMLLWQEWPLWQPDIIPELCETITDEYAELTRLTRDHPSVVVYSIGCELCMDVDECLMDELNATVRSLVSGVMVCDNSGSGESYEGLDFDFSDFIDYHPYCELHFFQPLLDNWRRDWQESRPLIFGEFCDSDTFRDINEIVAANNGNKPWWMTTDNPVTKWRSESKAMLEVQKRLKESQINFSPIELEQSSYAQSLVERKYILELLRRRRGIGGYVITGLRDTPISTSGMWDDLSRSKWSPAELRKVNDDAVLCLDVNRRRRWQNGGDRPDLLDAYNHWSGTTARWYVILNTTHLHPPPGSQVSWSLKNRNGVKYQDGEFDIEKTIFPGVPSELGAISCRLPNVDQPTEHLLEISLQGDGFAISNDWFIYIFPPLSDQLPDIAIVDPASIMDEWGEWLNQLPRVQIDDTPNAAYKIIISTVWNDRLKKFVHDGGSMILLQQGDGPLPAIRCPFWRESVILFPKHEVWKTFPHDGYASLQFFGVASDRAFISHEIVNSHSGAPEINPIMRRLDAREFHISDYIFEARIGKGMLIGCSLRLQGGMGAQPFGLERNVAGGSLLRSLIDYASKRK
jgi:hypothetical protein